MCSHAVTELVELLLDASVENAEDVAQDVCGYLQDTSKVFEQLASTIASEIPDADVCIGDHVLGRIAHKDGTEEWHGARVLEIAQDVIVVRFDDYGLESSLARCDLVLPSELADADDESNAGNGTCQICDQQTILTIHHMIPRSEHSKYLKRGFTRAQLLGVENQCLCCRRCHSMVHKFENNAVLAEKYFTLERIREHPRIQAYAHFARQRAQPMGKRR